MLVHHLGMLGRHHTNYNMQDIVLFQLSYHLNTAHTYDVVSFVGMTLVHHLQMLARRRTNYCAGDTISPIFMLPVSDPLQQRSFHCFCLAIGTRCWLNTGSMLLIHLRNKALAQHRVNAHKFVFHLSIY